MDSVNRFFLIAAGLIVTAGLVFLALRMADIGTETAEYVMEEFRLFAKDIKEEEMLQYDGALVSGSDVVNFIMRNLSKESVYGDSTVRITVRCGSEKITYSTYEEAKNIKNFSHENYINPMYMFQGTVIRNKNGVISEVLFEQR